MRSSFIIEEQCGEFFVSNKVSNNVSACVCVQLLYHVAKRQTLFFCVCACNFTFLFFLFFFYVILKKLVNKKSKIIFRSYLNILQKTLNHGFWKTELVSSTIHCIIQNHLFDTLPYSYPWKITHFLEEEEEEKDYFSFFGKDSFHNYMYEYLNRLVIYHLWNTSFIYKVIWLKNFCYDLGFYFIFSRSYSYFICKQSLRTSLI